MSESVRGWVSGVDDCNVANGVVWVRRPVWLWVENPSRGDRRESLTGGGRAGGGGGVCRLLSWGRQVGHRAGWAPRGSTSALGALKGPS